ARVAARGAGRQQIQVRRRLHTDGADVVGVRVREDDRRAARGERRVGAQAYAPGDKIDAVGERQCSAQVDVAIDNATGGASRGKQRGAVGRARDVAVVDVRWADRLQLVAGPARPGRIA